VLYPAAQQEEVKLLCSSCPKLQHITLQQQLLESVSHYGAQILSVTVLRNPECKVQNWSALMSSFPNLQRFEIGSLFTTDSLVCAIAQHCPRLRSLILNGDHTLTNATVSVLAESCTELEHLDLAVCLTEAAHLCLLQRCRKLTAIHFDYSPGVTTEVLAEMGRSFSVLLELGLMGWDGDMTVLAQHAHCWPHLKRLNLDETEGLQDDTLLAFSTHCSQLRVVGMYSCYKVTDAGITALARGCPYLQELQLWRCFEITGASLHAISAHCRYIEWVEISDACITSACAEQCRRFLT
jgi:F-box/leucine-rich repeat protein 2/20